MPMKKIHLPQFRSAVPVAIALLLCLVMGSATAWFAHSENRNNGFPLDDGWIHLQFAKNLHDYGSFSYFRNTNVTAGSTAPLYTFLLAAGFFFTSNEMILSYVLGILFFLLAVYTFYRLLVTLSEPGSPIPFIGACLLALEPRLHWAALSGMETTLFIFLLIAAFYFYKVRLSVPLGIVLGLLVWTRPEALILPLIFMIDWWYHNWLKTRHTKNRKNVESERIPFFRSWIAKTFAITVLITAGYFIFNAALSGSMLPNTYAAKLKYYSGVAEQFPTEVFQFLTDGHMIVIALFAGIFLFSVVTTIFQLRQQPMLIPVLWCTALFLAYWKDLPFLYQNGRYMMPLLPMFIVIGLEGMKLTLRALSNISSIFQKGKSRLIAEILIGVLMAAHFGYASWQGRSVYQNTCKYISDRQVAAARWIVKNLPRDAVIATHDIGAIAFYSDRKIVDMVGLISPEMVPRIGSLDLLLQFLAEKKVTHLAVLRNWFEIANQKLLFQTDERIPEIMEVFEFDPASVHFVPKNAGYLKDIAAELIRRGQLQEAGKYLQESLRIDPENATAYTMLGEILLTLQKYDQAEEIFRSALQRHTASVTAGIGLARALEGRGKYKEAIETLETMVPGNTNDPRLYQFLADFTKAYTKDTRRAEMYEDRYTTLNKTNLSGE
jgi:arabinofuranosyltransferase